MKSEKSCEAPVKAEDDLPDFPDSVATLWFLIRRLAGAMDREGEALFRRELGVSLSQFLVLSVVDAHPGPLSQQAVADRLGLTKGTVSRQIELAVEAGLMTAKVAAHTRREHVLTLTKGGTALVRKGDRIFERSRETLRAAVDPEALPATLRQLAGLLHAVEAMPDHVSGGRHAAKFSSVRATPTLIETKSRVP